MHIYVYIYIYIIFICTYVLQPPLKRAHDRRRQRIIVASNHTQMHTCAYPLTRIRMNLYVYTSCSLDVCANTSTHSCMCQIDAHSKTQVKCGNECTCNRFANTNGHTQTFAATCSCVCHHLMFT